MSFASPQVDQIESIVTKKLVTVESWVAQAKDAANIAINSLKELTPPKVELEFPVDAGATDGGATYTPGSAPVTPINIDPRLAKHKSTENVPFVDSVTPVNVKYEDYDEFETRPSEEVPQPNLAYPTADITDSPVADSITVPTAPDLDIEEIYQLDYVDIPTFSPEEVAAFDGHVPETGDAKNKLDINVANMESFIAKANNKLQDITGSGSDMSQFINDLRAQFFPSDSKYVVDREARQRLSLIKNASKILGESRVKEEQANIKYAANNFGIPPGSLVKEVNDLNIEASGAVMENSVEIAKENAKLQQDEFISDYTFLYQLDAISAEMQIAAAKQMLKNQVTLAKMHMDTYNGLVELVQKKIKASTIHTATFDPAVTAAVQQNSWMQVATSAQSANIEIDRAKINMFESQVKVSKAQASIKSDQSQASVLDSKRKSIEIKGYEENIQTVIANLDSYRSAIKSYSEYSNAAAAELEAYATQVDTLKSQTDVVTANTQVYVDRVQSSVAYTDKQKAHTDIHIDTVEANRAAYQSAVAANESYLKARINEVKGNLGLEEKRIKAFEENLKSWGSFKTAKSELDNLEKSAIMGSAETDANRAALQNQAQAETDRLNTGALSAKAKALSALAQGAMSALNVSSSATAAGAVGATYNTRVALNGTWGATTSKSETIETTVKV